MNNTVCKFPPDSFFQITIMINYLNKRQAIVAMHEDGFTNDFQLFGDKLLWVQEKIFIRSPDFTIVECHCFKNVPGKAADQIVFGIALRKYRVKGILINDYSCYTLATPKIIQTKMHELNAVSNER